MKTKILVAAVLILTFISCNEKDQSDPSKISYDYSLESNWMKTENTGKSVDVFYIFPTVVWTGKTDAADLNEAQKLEAQRAYLSNVGSMAEFANMYAPYYRQCTMDLLDLTSITNEEMVSTVSNGIGKQDIFAALDYYFANFNIDRPFILASHSQGTIIMRTVLEEYMQKDEAHKNYLKRMVATYMLGFSVPKTWLAENGLKGAERADDTGVIIAFNTEGPGATKTNLLVTSDDYVINPLTWTTSTEKATASMNKGCFEWTDEEAFEYRITKPGVADAQIDPDRASLICTTIDNYVSMEGDPFGDKSLHVQDWLGYYVNLTENAKTRVDAYFAAH